MATYTPNLNLGKPEATDPFGNFRQLFNDNMDILDNGGGGGSGGHTIVDENGSDMPAEGKLQFTGNVQVTDDNGNGKTVVNVSGGNNLILDAQIYSDTEKVVGVWRDNKPLYMRVWDFGSDIVIPNNSFYVTTIDSSNIETIVNSFGIYSTGATFYNLMVNTNGTNIRLQADRVNGSANVRYFVMQYTKTTDVAGSGGYEAYGFTPIIYSDVERKVGVWRDNKPLYQRTFDLGSDLSISYNSWMSSGITLTGVENLITAYGTRSDYSFQGYVLAWNDNNNLKVVTPRNGANSFIRYLTLQYTKTADVAGSGDYNTYGVPTVHYSTSEQVIGTWITGKPLYQKTIDLGSFVNSSTKTVAHGISNIDLAGIAKADGVIYNSTGNYSMFLPRVHDGGIGNQIFYEITTTSIIIYSRNLATASNFKGYVTIQYTKTTD